MYAVHDKRSEQPARNNVSWHPYSVSAFPLQAANKQAQAQLEGFAPAQLPLLLCALAALGQEPGAALVNAFGEALAHQELQVRALALPCGLCGSNVAHCPCCRVSCQEST